MGLKTIAKLFVVSIVILTGFTTARHTDCSP
jgi:hypothetical protein